MLRLNPAVIILLMIYGIISAPAEAHQPRFPGTGTTVVNDPDVSQAWYAELGGAPAEYRVVVKDSLLLYVAVLVPAMPFVTKDYNLKPVKPVLMAEGAYEAGSEYGFPVTPLWVRRQAYYSYLAGGHHTYGHNDSWRILPTWKEALDAPGAVQMGILKRIFAARSEWWFLVPDQAVLATGGQNEGEVLHLAARHQGGEWLMVYLGDTASFSVNMNKLSAARVRACWIDPRTGEESPIGVLGNTGVKTFTTPTGWEDALLVLEAAKKIY